MSMSTTNVSVAVALKVSVDELVARRGHGTSGGYACELVREESDCANLRALLQEGAASPVVGELNAPYFNSLRERANARAVK
jgi:antitoxin ParD1/3/4